jgi:hypothetical protein
MSGYSLATKVLLLVLFIYDRKSEVVLSCDAGCKPQFREQGRLERRRRTTPNK